MIKIGICDDMEEDLRRVEDIVRHAAEKSTLGIQINCFHSGENLLNYMEQKGEMDIVFLDICMKEMNGVETARCIRKKIFYLF